MPLWLLVGGTVELTKNEYGSVGKVRGKIDYPFGKGMVTSRQSLTNH